MLFAAQEQALRTNSIKAKIDKQPVSPKYKLCGETDTYLVSGQPKLAQKQYKRRHDNVARRDHWELCKKHTVDWKAQTGGMSIHLLMSWKMMK